MNIWGFFLMTYCYQNILENENAHQIALLCTIKIRRACPQAHHSKYMTVISYFLYKHTNCLVKKIIYRKILSTYNMKHTK